jgi:hypothetical protein
VESQKAGLQLQTGRSRSPTGSRDAQASQERQHHLELSLELVTAVHLYTRESPKPQGTQLEAWKERRINRTDCTGHLKSIVKQVSRENRNNQIMFRASPWITYDPPAGDSQAPSQQPDNDTEMDAPQISTLHDDGESPPSNSPARTGKFRVKLLVNEARMGTKFITFNGETGEEAGIGEEAEEDEPEEDEEEDQLIDDQDDTSTHAASASGAVPAKAGTKRPAAKTKSSQAKRRARPSAPSAPSPASQAPTAPSEPKDSPPKDLVPDAPTLDPSPAVPQAASTPPAAASKKKTVPKGTTAAQRAPRKSAPTK